ncbi:hypothetical protein V5G24_20055 [Xanthobacter sp. VTT E-85241]|uniref:A1S_2505 family phage non-structural protein n=1 Tax=Roseixanthobacter finlandensis TaxID=3119922 RepID=UPI00372AC779
MNAPIFVFGSNLAGRHGAGAALWARQNRGAVYGQGEGLQGHSYGIPTKDGALKTRSLSAIDRSVRTFLEFARRRPDLTFQVTPIGCGLAGYRHEDIAPMFRDAPENCTLPDEFKAVLSGRAALKQGGE